MFTGLVEETGRVVWLRKSSQSGLQLRITAPLVSRGTHRGESVAVNGCCLTLSARSGEDLTFDILQETLDRTNLHRLRPEMQVNLERSLPANGRFGGHVVQGHVDCASEIVSLEKVGSDYRLEIDLPDALRHYVAVKGSISVNGISLTVAEKCEHSLVFWIIPHTRRATNLHTAAAGDLVNLEFDIFAKYVESHLERFQAPAY